MNIVEINAYSNGSTGKIMMQIADTARKKGHNVITFSTSVFSIDGPTHKEIIRNHRFFSSYLENFFHYAISQFTDGNGFYSSFATLRLIHRLKQIKPDIIQLHNLHQFCINISLLFRYIKKNKINTVWTFHDCWAFTGHCMHFDNIQCNLWKTGCGHCPQKHYNPRSRVDRSHAVWKKKSKILSEIDTLTIVTPSKWLANLVKQSFFNRFPIVTINNGINTTVFSPKTSNFRTLCGIEARYMILGVASDWGEMKGLDVFIQLAQELGKEYAVVLVGIDDQMKKRLPSSIYAICRTNNQQELAEIYSAADVFVNPTREDTFPTVNMEALACGTPVITYQTGGSPEIIDEASGVSVEKDNYEALKKAIIDVVVNKRFSRDKCIARASKYDSSKCFSNYVELYEQILAGSNNVFCSEG